MEDLEALEIEESRTRSNVIILGAGDE